MKLNRLIIGLFLAILISCNTTSKKPETTNSKASSVQIIGAMKNVMWKGELAGVMDLDTIKNKENLYGLGPVEYLRGELLIIDGHSYTSSFLTDSTMLVEETFKKKAPFFVYANATDWNIENLPKTIKTINDLDAYISEKTSNTKRPFAFKLSGQVLNANIHIQNLPKGTTVSSPDEAHQGQVNYSLQNTNVDIVGFFSTEHKGVFTHHDSNMHMHLITADKSKMGHLDSVVFGNEMKLYLPKN